MEVTKEVSLVNNGEMSMKNGEIIMKNCLTHFMKGPGLVQCSMLFQLSISLCKKVWSTFSTHIQGILFLFSYSNLMVYVSLVS